MLLYIDTCVYRDYLDEDRKSLSGRDLSKPAMRFFSSVKRKEHTLVLSSLVLEELGYKIQSDRYKEFFAQYNRLFVRETYSVEEETYAKQLSLKYCGSEEHYKDALHSIIAKRTNAVYIVTRNVSHFESFFKEINVDIKRPEEL